MHRSDIATLIMLLIMCLMLGLAGLAGPKVFEAVLHLWIGGAVGCSIVYFREMRRQRRK